MNNVFYSVIMLMLHNLYFIFKFKLLKFVQFVKKNDTAYFFTVELIHRIKPSVNMITI